MFSLQSPHRGDSNEYTRHTIFNMKKKTTLNYPKIAAMEFFQGIQEQVRNSRGKRAISVRATEVLHCSLSFRRSSFAIKFLPVLSISISSKEK